MFGEPFRYLEQYHAVPRKVSHKCKSFPNINSLQRHQKHDHMTLSSSNIEANIGKMRETLKSDVGRDRKWLKFFGQTGIFEKTSFLKALRNFSRRSMILF